MSLSNFKNDYFSTNVDDYSLIHTVFLGKKYSDQDFKEYLIELEKAYEENKSFVVMTSSLKLNYMSAKHRIELGNWTNKKKEMIAERNREIASIMTSEMKRTVLKGILSVEPPPCVSSQKAKKKQKSGLENN